MSSIHEQNWALREVDIMVSMNHPCVLKLYEYFDRPECCYLILDYADGGTLFDRITTNPKMHLPEDICKLFFYQLCNAIGYLHERHVSRRDLKPENILMAHC